MSRTINEKGCVQAGEEWVERNLIIISSTAIFLAFMQVCPAIPFSNENSWFYKMFTLVFHRYWEYALRKIYAPTFLPRSQNGDESWQFYAHIIHVITVNTIHSVGFIYTSYTQYYRYVVRICKMLPENCLSETMRVWQMKD